MKLTSKVTLITNVSQFMGPACTEEFAKEGAVLALHDRTETRAKPALEVTMAYGREALGVAGDLTRAAEANRVVVNAIAQNFVENPTYFGPDIVSNPEKLSRVLRHVPAGRLARSEESARLAVYLASEEADFFCGQVIPFAGGWA
ncbi:MAG: SDR family oxidoreductase [Candidatus Rokuibacteriota bacterium]